MTKHETLTVSKLEILSAVNNVNSNLNKHSTSEVLSLNNAWKGVLRKEQTSNVYLRNINVSPDEFEIFKRYGVSSVPQDALKNVTKESPKVILRNFITQLLAIFRF